jgi:hypothetical protein
VLFYLARGARVINFHSRLCHDVPENSDERGVFLEANRRNISCSFINPDESSNSYTSGRRTVQVPPTGDENPEPLDPGRKNRISPITKINKNE